MKYWIIGFWTILLAGGYFLKEHPPEKVGSTSPHTEMLVSSVVPVIKKQPEKPVMSLRLPGIGADTIRKEEPDDQFFPTLPEQHYPRIFAKHPKFRSDGFDFPVGKPHGEEYFKALDFGEKRHLGEDWNGLGGGNTDLGDPVFAAANGLVTYARNVCCGWGKVVRIVHYVGQDPVNPFVESVYAHLNNIDVKTGDLVKRGKRIGTIGTANGKYSAHLHFELRDFINMSLGPGYSDDVFGYLVPTAYIEANRPSK